MKASVQEMRAKVVAAEAEIPKAISEALRSGNLGVLDYYNMQNIMSDTQMRNSISSAAKPEQEIKIKSKELIPLNGNQIFN
jgi:uncharacterized protein YqfA (UPF0365 family)